MTKEQLKNFLEDYWYDNHYLNEKVKELEKIKVQNEKLNHLKTYFNEKNSSSSLLVINEEQEEQRMKNIVNKKQMIENLIESLSQPYRTIMYFKYICFLTFDQIADKMNYSTKRIYQLHNEGLTNLLKYINSNNIDISTY